jgi:hypothetical protein
MTIWKMSQRMGERIMRLLERKMDWKKKKKLRTRIEPWLRLLGTAGGGTESL